MEHTDEDLPVGTLFAGRFEIESLLGAGGMGAVYLARHQVLHRHFALKVIRQDLLADVTITARFRREARAASRIEHPNIIQIVDFGQADDGRLYLAMEYVEGPTLAQVLAKDGPFPVSRALHVLEQIVDALAAAHNCNVIHRDLKPINIILTTSRDGPDQVKILDFGLAKILDIRATGGLSVDGRLFGTPEYMSPERCMDSPADHRADIYSLGIIGFELLVGRVPFQGRIVRTMAAQVSETPPPPSRASGRGDIPAELDQLVLRCLSKRPEERFQTADEMLGPIRALQRTAGEAVAPPEASPLQWKQQVLETLPPHALVMDEEPAPGERVGDTVVVKRPAGAVEPTAASRDIQALEDLAYALRDRGLGTPEITHRLALLLEARDSQIHARSALQMLEHQSEELQMTARIRESRLAQVLNQLEHELGLLADSDAAASGRLEALARSVTERIRDIAEELDGHGGEILARVEQVRAALVDLARSTEERAEALRSLIRELRPTLDGGDRELELLLSAAEIG